MDLERDVIVEIREGYPVLCPHWLSDDDLVDIIELIPVFIPVEPNRLLTFSQTSPCFYLSAV